MRNRGSLALADIRHPGDSSERRAAMARLSTRIVVTVVLASGLAGCAASMENFGAAYVDPAKFTFYQCADLNQRAQALLKREQQLRDDMTRAEQGPGGGFVSTIAYRNDYLAVRGELKLLEKTAAEKKCDLRLGSPVDAPIR
jgi:hypothetical protein